MSECAVGEFVKQVNILNEALGSGCEPGESYQLRQRALDAYSVVLEAGELKACTVVAVIEDLLVTQVETADIVRSPLTLSVAVQKEHGIFLLSLFDSGVELEVME
ncbi:TPA: hypothetical protein EYO12_01865 [Candidatus Saccharibacteria bacterium]|nr:hypothetical protein [Candidatus Saccharibacteria bacterium]HIO87464.1 hypothetical protein [Candidatus Saccharibacteria bacterium]